MSEVILNGTFNGDLTGWSAASGLAFTWDSTGAEHSGGSMKASHTGAVSTTVRYRMGYNVSITNVDDIATATMDMWTQWNDAVPEPNTYVSSSYIKFWLQLEDPDDTFYTIASSTNYFGTLSDTWLASDVSVKSTLQTGGIGTWTVWVVCDIYRAAITTTSCPWLVGWIDDISLDISYSFEDEADDTVTLSESTSDLNTILDTATDTVTVSDTGSEIIVAEDSATDTVTVSDNPADFQVISLETDFAYYFGSFDGKLYREGSSYKSDAGTAIDSYWESKTTDFADEHQDCLGRLKTVYFVDLWYKDISALSNVMVSVSTDAGVTWTDSTRAIGNADGKNKKARFFFHLTSEIFKFRVVNNTDSDSFQWIAIEPNYALRGEVFEL